VGTSYRHPELRLWSHVLRFTRVKCAYSCLELYNTETLHSLNTACKSFSIEIWLDIGRVNNTVTNQ